MRTRTRTARDATLLALALLAVSEFAGAQSGSAMPQPSAAEFSIPLVTPEQMTADDQAAAQRQQQTIAQSAQFYGYTLDSSYAYREIACPVAPNHLLLAYEATSPNGSVSRFTAVVGRGAKEETAARHSVAQIIPILHFGVVPFGPAIANPHSIDVFNSGVANAPSATEVLAATQVGNQPLLVRALCYLAMVGEEPAALRSPGLEQATIHAPTPTLVFQDRGKIRQMISVRSAANYQVWALTFRPGGKLLTATRAEHPIDRTPLVLNAANTNTGSPAEPTTPPTTPKTANSAPSQVFAEQATSTPVTPEPATSAPAATIAARDESAPAPPTPAPSVPPAPATPSATADAAKLSTPPTPRPAAAAPTASAPPALTPTPASANAEVPQPSSPPPAENTAPVTEPVTAPVSSPAATAVQPIAPAAPPVAVPPPPANPPPSPSVSPTPAATAAVQPPETPAAPAPAARVTAAAATGMQPSVKQSPPPPPGRFIPNPPPPPSRFIPDSALKTPPHLPQ